MNNLSVILIQILLLVCLVSAKDRCEPGFANICFSAVHSDLNKVINSNDKDIYLVNNNSLENLCNAIDDAINCTSDIIDVDCSVEEGKTKFDKWNSAFLQTYYELCDANGKDDKIFLRALMLNVNCWNATQFFECLETNTGISNVSDLMTIDISKKECDVLYSTFELCRVKQLEATKYFCTRNETMESVSIVHHLFDTFMASSHCINYYTNGNHNNHIDFIQIIVLLILLYVSTFIPTN